MLRFYSSPVPLSPYGQPIPELLPCFRGAPQSGEGCLQGSNPGAVGGGVFIEPPFNISAIITRVLRIKSVPLFCS